MDPMIAPGRPAPKGFLLPIGLVALVSLVLATWAGLAQLGVKMATPPVLEHGPLMILGFLGTVICVERAVGLGRGWAWIAPGLAAAGTALVVFERHKAGMALLFGAGVMLAVVYVVAMVIADYPDHVMVQGLGALAWMTATAGLFAGRRASDVVSVLAVFLVLTIIGERLELSRMAPNLSLVRNRLVVVAAAGLLAFSAGVIWAGPTASRIAGIALVIVAVLSAGGDIARRTLKAGGVTTFMADAILAGYVWLVVAGVLWLSGGMNPGTFIYDAALHTLFVGFVLSMVFAHVPVIVPSVAGVALPFHPVWWLPLLALHLTLVVRVAGDLFEIVPLRTAGGVGNVVALGLFVLVAVGSGLRARRH